VPEEGIKQIDFLSGIVGLDTESVRKRASQITLADGVAIQLPHPLDVLESRLRNLDWISPCGTAASKATSASSIVMSRVESSND
jgi:hypothetical protein